MKASVYKNKYDCFLYFIGNATEVMLYPAHTFTHITCLYFTIYDIKNKFLFFRNCYEWLQPGGYLTVHLVDRDSIDPLLTNRQHPFLLSDANKVKIGDATSYVRFNNFKYKSKFRDLLFKYSGIYGVLGVSCLLLLFLIF